MKNLHKYALPAASILVLLAFPLTGLAAGLGNLFSPPASDVSLQVMQNIFGTGTNAYEGKLIRPLLMVFSAGIVIFMGAIFAWNLTKFVLHTAQEGEMMMGKGKTLGLVVLRSVFGISMVVPIYGSAAYKGLSLSFIFVAWVITQGIGLADQGVNAAVDYLQAGGTLYQSTAASQDTKSKQELVDPVMQVVSAQTCVQKLRQVALDQAAKDRESDERLREIGETPPARSPISATDFGYHFDAAKGTARFGTRNKNPATSKDTPFLSECGRLDWSGLFSTDTKDPATPNYNRVLNVAMLQIISDTEPLARSIAQAYPGQQEALKTRMLNSVTDNILNYANLITPLRNKEAANKNAEAYKTLEYIRHQGWIVLGAYYPMMGKLNQDTKRSISDFLPRSTAGDLASGVAKSPDSAYDFGRLSAADKTLFQDQAKYVLSNINAVKERILLVEGTSSTLQEQLARAAALAAAGVSSEGPFSGLNPVINNPLTRAAAYVPYGIEKGLGAIDSSGKTTRFIGIGGEAQTSTTSSLGGVFEKKKLQQSAAAVGVASAVGGPVAWVTMPPILVIMVDTIERFKVALDQVKNPDPLLALQDFGFYVMGQAVLMLGIVLGGTFLVSIPFGFTASLNTAGAFLSQTSNLLAPIFAMFFAALAAAGFGFGIYIPMIPLIVWISAILGWIGHSFQSIIGAPLVALRMTTAEGEGLLGGATEGVMMLLGVLLTPFLLVVGFVANLIILKQLLIVVNYLFSLFVSFSFGPRGSGGSTGSIAWAIIGAPAILLVYFTLVTGVVQALSTKLIGDFPGEVLRHLHNAMTGHKAAEQMSGKMEQASEKGAGHAGKLGGEGARFDSVKNNMLGGKKDGEGGGGGGSGGGGGGGST